MPASTSLVEHWEEAAERPANLKRAMRSREVGASAAELRDIHRLLTRVAMPARPMTAMPHELLEIRGESAAEVKSGL